jgi:hypothetical protein
MRRIMGSIDDRDGPVGHHGATNCAGPTISAIEAAADYFFFAALAGILDAFELCELYIAEFTIHPLDPADIDVLHDIARFRIGHRPALAFPGHSHRCRSGCTRFVL